MHNEDTIRGYVERQTGRPIDDAIWEYLVEQRYIDEYIQGEASPNQVLRAYRRLEVMVRHSHHQSAERSHNAFEGEPPEPPEAIVQHLSAIACSRVSEVRLFRQEHLGSEAVRLSAQEALQWLDAQLCQLPPDVAKALRPLLHVEEQSKPGVEHDLRAHVRHVAPLDLWYVLLAMLYDPKPVPPVAIDRIVELIGETALGDLLVAAAAVAKLTKWSVYEAASFVLTSTVPANRGLVETDVDSPRTRGLVKANVGGPLTLTTLSQLGHHVAPFRALDWSSHRKRVRSFAHRTAALLRFAYARRPDTPWAEIRAEWNGQNPDWAYDDDRPIARDYNRALKKLRERYG